MVDMSDTIIPKSDQLNADDLIAGPMTVTITNVARASTAEQPIAVNFKGDNGKPYMPCKSMRRVMVFVWGDDASTYAGRSMTLYRDPEVTWGGMAVGGIRISHMSHLDGPMVLALTATKKARKPYEVMPLVIAAPPAPARTLGQFLDELETNLRAAPNYAAVMALVEHPDTRRAQDKATNGAAQRLADMIEAATARVTAADGDDFPGVVTEAGQ
jgi:hypothetical protein